MSWRLLFLFVGVPLIELIILIRIGEIIGPGYTILIIVLTGLVGTALARYEGLGVWRRFSQRLNRGEVPGAELADGLIILVCGALLMTPGVVTDIIGLLGLVPFTRAFIRKQIASQMRRQANLPGAQFSVFEFGSGRADPQPHFRGQPPPRQNGTSRQDITDEVEDYRRGKSGKE